MFAIEEDEEPTAKTCPECKGEGVQRFERGTRYTAQTCRWCKGTGRVPMSGTYDKVKA